VRTPDREGLSAHLAARGVQTQALYPVPLHKQPAYAHWEPAKAGSLVECERCCREVLSLPVHPALHDEEVERVCAEVLAWTREVERT
jgi:dTDP-4-amino-4,6-dideoxygalactose transaminase